MQAYGSIPHVLIALRNPRGPGKDIRQTMERRNNYDVTNRVNTTDPAAVNGEINRIFVKLYP